MSISFISEAFNIFLISSSVPRIFLFFGSSSVFSFRRLFGDWFKPSFMLIFVLKSRGIFIRNSLRGLSWECFIFECDFKILSFGKSNCGRVPSRYWVTSLLFWGFNWEMQLANTWKKNRKGKTKKKIYWSLFWRADCLRGRWRTKISEKDQYEVRVEHNDKLDSN